MSEGATATLLPSACGSPRILGTLTQIAEPAFRQEQGLSQVCLQKEDDGALMLPSREGLEESSGSWNWDGGRVHMREMPMVWDRASCGKDALHLYSGPADVRSGLVHLMKLL